MADYSAPIGALLETVAPVVGAGLRALLRTVVGMMLLCAAATLGSVWLAAHGSMARGVIAAVLCLVAGVIVTGVLAVKNAVLRALLTAVQQLALGGRVTRLLFERLGVGEASSHGERSGTLGRVVERLPLRDAEARLRGAVEGLLVERSEKTGLRAWLARRLLSAAVERVESLTLARLRSDDAAHGGVDLVLVRDELAGAIDGLLVGQLEGHALRLTGLIAGAYAVAAVLIGVGVSKLEL